MLGTFSGDGEDRPRSVVPSDEADGDLECDGRGGGNSISVSIADTQTCLTRSVRSSVGSLIPRLVAPTAVL